MQRDMDLCRAILLEIESFPVGRSAMWDAIDSKLSDVYGIDVVNEHVDLLNDAEFLKGYHDDGASVGVEGLSWKGHDFIEAARSDSMWEKAKAELKAKGVGLSLDVLKSALVFFAKQAMGI